MNNFLKTSFKYGGKQHLLRSSINWEHSLIYRLEYFPTHSDIQTQNPFFETNSNDTKVSVKKSDCPTNSWLIDTHLSNFYSLITALDSVERKKLWSTLNWSRIKTFIWLPFRNAKNEKLWLLSEAFPETDTPPHSLLFITPLAYSYHSMYHKA